MTLSGLLPLCEAIESPENKCDPFMSKATTQPEQSETPPLQRWVYRSNPSTADNRIVSLLAIVETIIAVCLYSLIIQRFDTYLHLAIAACIAPFLLLRTDYSTRIGLRILAHAIDIYVIWETRFLSWPYYTGFIFFMIIACLLFVLIPCVRLYASLVGFIFHPIISISNIPSNWVRINLCVDSYCNPEILPGIHHSNNKEFMLELSDIRYSGYSNLFYYLLCMIGIVFIYGPSLFYRWSIKGTSIIWLPLLWAAGLIVDKSSKQDDDLIRRQADHVRNGLLTKIVLIFSTITIFFGFLKLYLFAEWARVADVWKATMPSLIDELIAPLYVYPWHITALINSILMWSLILWLDKRVRSPQDYSAQTTASVMRYSLWTRRLLTLYTSANCLFIVLYLAELFTHLPFQWRLFTWTP